MRAAAFSLMIILAIFFTFHQQCQGQQFSIPSAVTSDPNVVWVPGPQRISFGDYANIDIPAGYRLTDAHGARLILDSLNSPVPDDVVGVLSDSSGKWWAMLEYAPKGYVKDTEQIDWTAALKVIQQAGGTLTWQSAPVYDPQAHSLAWSLQAPSKKESSQTVVLFGRNGFIKMTSSQPYPATDAPSLKQLAGDIIFNDGERYADYQNGDKIAQIGLADLITGGKPMAKTATSSHAFGGAMVWIYSGIFVCAVIGGVMLFRNNGKNKKVSRPAHASAPVPVSKPAVSQQTAHAVSQPAVAPQNGHQNGAASSKVLDQKRPSKQFHRNRRKKVFNYPKFYTNVMRELSLHSYGSGPANGKTNGHANGHANGNGNGRTNGHANGHSNGHANGANGINETLREEIVQLIANQKNLIEEQKCLLDQQTKLIAEKRWLIEEQSAFLKGQAENQYPLKFE